MVDSLSRTPSPSPSQTRVSVAREPAAAQQLSLQQITAPRSQSPVASSLIHTGRSASPPNAAQVSGEVSPRASQLAVPDNSAPAGRLQASARAPVQSGRRTSLAEHRISQHAAPTASALLERWAEAPAGRDEQRAYAVQLIRLAGQTESERLDLSELNLSSLPERLAELVPTVAYLDVQNNRLSSLHGLQGMDNLLLLDVQNNALNSLQSLPFLDGLQRIDYSHNSIDRADDDLLYRLQGLRLALPESSLDNNQRQILGQRVLFHLSETENWALPSAEPSPEPDPALPMAGVASDFSSQAEHFSPLSEATSRWAGNLSADEAQSRVKNFYSAVMPKALHDQLHTDPGSFGLLTLCAGLAFSADNAPERADYGQVSAQLRDGLSKDLAYLHESQDRQLLHECQEAADSAVNRCGDRVAYGRTQLHQVIEKHQMIHGLFSAEEIFAGLDRHFNQSLVEAKASDIAQARAPQESVEFYQDLAAKVTALGYPLVETAHANLYGELFQVTPKEVNETLRLIEQKRSSPAYIDSLANHAAVQHVLKQVFAADFATMIRQREEQQELATDIMLDPLRPAAEQQAASARLDELGKRENAWYRDKAGTVLDDPELLFATHESSLSL